MSFPQIDGWVLSPKIQFYTPNNLYDYIDGAADLYHSYRFQELRVAEYRDQRGDLVTVEIYRHNTPLDAFGIYSQEQPPDPAFVDAGARAYVQDVILNVVTGRYYIRIVAYQQGFHTGDILRTFAQQVVKNLGAEATLPKILNCFPQNRKYPYSEKYIAGRLLGHEFLSSGFMAQYADSNMAFQMFIIAAEDTSEGQEMLKQYLKFTRHSQTEPTQGRYTLSDPDHGEIALSWRGRYIWGVINLAQADLRDEYLRLTEELLVKHGLL